MFITVFAFYKRNWLKSLSRIQIFADVDNLLYYVTM